MHEQMYMCMSMDMYVDKSVGTDMYMISCVQVHVHVTGQGPVHAYGDYHVCVRACLQICIHVLVCARAGRPLAGRGLILVRGLALITRLEGR